MKDNKERLKKINNIVNGYKRVIVKYKTGEVIPFLYIEDEDDLMLYANYYNHSMIWGSFRKLIHTDIDSFVEENKTKGNTNDLMMAIAYQHSGKSLPETCADLVDKKIFGMQKLLRTGRKLLVNQAGGYTYFDPEKMEIESEEFVTEYKNVHAE